MADTYAQRGPLAPTAIIAAGGIVISYGGGDQDVTANRVRGVFIGTAGNLKVDMADGSTVTFSNLAAGQVYWFQITKVYQTGSTAAGVLLV